VFDRSQLRAERAYRDEFKFSRISRAKPGVREGADEIAASPAQQSPVRATLPQRE
jgi:hypothetical protein